MSFTSKLISKVWEIEHASIQPRFEKIERKRNDRAKEEKSEMVIFFAGSKANGLSTKTHKKPLLKP